MLNDKPCNTCANYDVIPSQKKNRRGWCVAKSKYHAEDQQGQIIPANAVRVARGAMRAEPFIVIGSKVQANCAQYKPAPK